MQVDFVILADAAHVAEGKLYLMGGGWTRLFARQVPFVHALAIAVGFLVPWDETNEPHDFELKIVSEDGQSVIPPMQGQMEVGRPPGIKKGTEQRGMITVATTVEFPHLGRYEIRLSADGELVKTTAFDVVPAKSK